MSIFRIAKLYNVKLAQVKSENYQTLYGLYNEIQSFYKKFPNNKELQILQSKIESLLRDVSQLKINDKTFHSRMIELDKVFDDAYNSSKREAKYSNQLYEWGTDIVSISGKLDNLLQSSAAGAEADVSTQKETATGSKMWNGKAPLPFKPKADANKALQEAYNNAYRTWAQEWKEEIEKRTIPEILDYVKELKQFDSKTANDFNYWVSYFYPGVMESMSYMRSSPQGAGSPTVTNEQWEKEWKEITSTKDVEKIHQYMTNLNEEATKDRSKKTKIDSFKNWIYSNPNLKSMLIFYIRQKQKR
jgi:hypothetical protein